jgi:hypothetical protein
MRGSSVVATSFGSSPTAASITATSTDVVIMLGADAAVQAGKCVHLVMLNAVSCRPKASHSPCHGRWHECAGTCTGIQIVLYRTYIHGWWCLSSGLGTRKSTPVGGCPQH